MAEISKDLVKTYTPTCFGAVSLSTFVCSMQMNRRRLSSLMLSLKEMEAGYKKFMRKATPNNQLKRQGKPMRRKGS